MKKLIISTILLTVSLNCSAYNASPGVHPVLIESVCKGFSNCKTSDGSEYFKKKILRSMMFVSAMAETKDVIAKLFTSVDIYSYHHITIVNETNDVVLYRYMYKLQAGLNERKEKFEVYLHPKDSFEEAAKVMGTLSNLEVEGKFPIVASTVIEGAESLKHEYIAQLTVL